MKIIKIGAVWCPGCLVMQKTWKKILEKYNNLDIMEIDYDMEHDLAVKYNPEKKLPLTIFLDNNGNELERVIGEIAYERLERLISEYEKY